MNQTNIKTRLGLILQSTTREALEIASLSYKENWQYDSKCEIPDFVIPDSKKPKYVLEIHQTDARNSFQMKVLRSFTAVTEAKSHFGNSIISVNVLFGDPDREIPESNLQALCNFFDVNIIPKREIKSAEGYLDFEEKALGYASDENCSVSAAVQRLTEDYQIVVESLGDLIKATLKDSVHQERLLGLWDFERERVKSLSAPPGVGRLTYYKRGLLQSLFLSDEHFSELLLKQGPNKLSTAIQDQLKLAKLVAPKKTIRGEILALSPGLREIVHDSTASELRKVCEEQVRSDPTMFWFFEDIRNTQRRKKMVRTFTNHLKEGSDFFLCGVKKNLLQGTYEGIEHSRCWMADLMPILVGESHNSFNRRMFQHPEYMQNLGNPFNNIAIRSPRLGTDAKIIEHYAIIAVRCFIEACSSINLTPEMIRDSELEGKLLQFRIDASIKLQKLNPLYLVLESIIEKNGLRVLYQGTQSFLSDLSDPNDPLGKYRLYHITNGSKTILANAVAVHDHHGDDKSKEWGGRRRSTLYRSFDNEVVRSGYQEGIFVIDGEWEQKDVERLYRSGWNHVIRLYDFEQTVQKVFGL